MSQQDIAEGCDSYPAEIGDSVSPFTSATWSYSCTILQGLRFLLILVFLSFIPSSFPLHFFSCPSPQYAPLYHQPPPQSFHPHRYTLYAGRLHRLISPHCDTFGAAACGLLIISTADSRHAPLFPTIQHPPAHTQREQPEIY